MRLSHYEQEWNFTSLCDFSTHSRTNGSQLTTSQRQTVTPRRVKSTMQRIRKFFQLVDPNQIRLAISGTRAAPMPECTAISQPIRAELPPLFNCLNFIENRQSLSRYYKIQLCLSVQALASPKLTRMINHKFLDLSPAVQLPSQISRRLYPPLGKTLPRVALELGRRG